MLCEKKECTGCGACYNVCPTKSICMEQDEEGFYYPRVLRNQCIECSLCETVCPILNKISVSTDTQSYGANNKNSIVRSKSSSGVRFFPADFLFLVEYCTA